MSDIATAPEKVFLIYRKSDYPIGEENKPNSSLSGEFTYTLVSAIFNEGRANEEIKKDPSNLVKKVIEFEKKFIKYSWRFKDEKR